MKAHPDYFTFIKESIKDPTNIIPIFADWLEEDYVRIRSQQWREIQKLLPHVEYIRNVQHDDTLMMVQMLTKHRYISIMLFKMSGGTRIDVEIKKRKGLFIINPEMVAIPALNWKKVLPYDDSVV